MSDVSKTNEARQEAAETLHKLFPGYMWDHYLNAVDALEAATRVPVQGEPNDEREALASVEAELAEWLSGKRSWCDQHHGLLNQFELTARADEAQIRLLMTRRDALRTEVQGEPSDEEVDRARDVIDRTFGWKHLRKYGPRSEEWMDQLRDGLVMGVLGGARATVPDAATEERVDRWMQLVGKGVEERMAAEAERDAALAAVERARATAISIGLLGKLPPGDHSEILSAAAKDILAALDGAPGPEGGSNG